MNRHKKQIVSKRQTAARPTSGSLGESKKTLVDLAQAYHQQGELSRAIATYELAIRRQPGRAEVLQGLGTAMFQSGRVSDAVKVLEHSLKLNPHEATTWNTLGAAYRSLARHTEAQAAYSEAIRLNPKYLEPWLNLGRVLWSTKRYEQALATLRALPEPTVESWRMQAEILTACGDLSEAKIILDRLTLNNAPSVELSIAHGNLLAKLGHLEKAEAAFLTALRLDKGCVAALVNLGNLHQSQGNTYTSRQLFEIARNPSFQSSVAEVLNGK